MPSASPPPCLVWVFLGSCSCLSVFCDVFACQSVVCFKCRRWPGTNPPAPGLGTLGASRAPFWVPLGFPWALFGALGHLLVSPWTLFGTKTKKETKSDMEDPRFGVQVGTQNRHFSEKSGNKHEKMCSQTGSAKQALS